MNTLHRIENDNCGKQKASLDKGFKMSAVSDSSAFDGSAFYVPFN